MLCKLLVGVPESAVSVVERGNVHLLRSDDSVLLSLDTE